MTAPLFSIPRVAVGVIILNKRGEIFIAKSYKWHGKWMVPGGHVEFGETVVSCARREIREELGIELDEITLVSVQEEVFPQGFFEQRHFIFFNFTARARSENICLNDEMSEWKWVSPAEALSCDLNESTRKFLQHYMSGMGVSGVLLEKEEKGE